MKKQQFKPHFVIDTRESSAELFNQLSLQAAVRDFTFEKNYLVGGDVLCLEAGLIIERKEAQDFVASIMDQRLHNQIQLMYSNYPNFSYYIIVEGDPYRTRSSINKNAIIGKMVSILAKTNFKVVFVPDTESFVYACYNIATKLSERDVGTQVFHKEKLIITDDEVIVNMLQQIEGLGYDRAKLIAEKYDYSIIKLITESTEESLQEVPGVGKILSHKILEILRK